MVAILAWVIDGLPRRDRNRLYPARGNRKFIRDSHSVRGNLIVVVGDTCRINLQPGDSRQINAPSQPLIGQGSASAKY
jgi:hypothetical protein